MEEPDTIFSIPTYRLRDVPEPIERYEKISGVTDTKLRCSFSTTPASQIITSTILSSEKPELPTHFIMLGHAKRRGSFRYSCSVCASQSWRRLSAICFVQAMAATGTLR